MGTNDAMVKCSTWHQYSDSALKSQIGRVAMNLTPQAVDAVSPNAEQTLNLFMTVLHVIRDRLSHDPSAQRSTTTNMTRWQLAFTHS
jgi:hypothetical protein